MLGWKFVMLLLDILDWLADPSKHFLLAFLAGVLVWQLTSTISYALLRAWERGTHRQASSAVVFGMTYSCILLCIAAALLSHYGLDFLHIWYTSPLDPPLELVVPTWLH